MRSDGVQSVVLTIVEVLGFVSILALGQHMRIILSRGSVHYSEAIIVSVWAETIACRYIRKRIIIVILVNRLWTIYLLSWFHEVLHHVQLVEHLLLIFEYLDCKFILDVKVTRHYIRGLLHIVSFALNVGWRISLWGILFGTWCNYMGCWCL